MPSTGKCQDCDSCDCAESEYGKTFYPRAYAQSIVKGFEPGTKFRNPSANTEGVVLEKRYDKVLVHVTKQMIKPRGALDFIEDEADFQTTYYPKFLIPLGLRIYVSCMQTRHKAARFLMNILESNHHTITFDWTKGYDNWDSYSAEECSKEAVADIEGVKNADVLVYLLGDSLSTGCCHESGAALASGVPIIVYDIGARNYGFFLGYHPNVRYTKCLYELLDWLRV
jgi:hypothetical protein